MYVFIKETFTIQILVLITYDEKYFQSLYLILPIRLKIVIIVFVIYFILFNVAKEKNTMYVGSIHQNKHQILSIMLISHRVILCTLTIMR